MRRLKEALWNNVFTADLITYDNHLWSRMEDFSSLLIGETGTGKGAAAAAIGRSGFIPFDPETGRFATSFQRSFIAANLSQFPESLIESELFGHCEGAFTGAVKDHKGVFERCSQYGSLLLDEIGELSVPVQVKLLQVLQERIFTPVGSDRHMRFSGRVIAATNQSLVSIRNSGAFRDDFFYRLSSDVIVVPPLRQRIAESRGELELLISVVMTRILGVNEPDITRNVAEILGINLTHDYCWPGNVRELEQTVRRILITGGYAPKGVASFSRRDFVLAEVLSNTSLSMSELASQYCSSLYALYGNYEAVARHTGLDARTVKKHLLHT